MIIEFLGKSNRYLISGQMEFYKYEMKRKSPTEDSTEFFIGMRNILRVDCFEGYRYIHGKCRKIV